MDTAWLRAPNACRKQAPIRKHDDVTALPLDVAALFRQVTRLEQADLQRLAVKQREQRSSVNFPQHQ
jgi:hypothetical protein